MDRVTVVGNVYHTSTENGVVDFPMRFGRHLKTTEQPYVRRLNLTEEWKLVDTGWLDDCSLVAIENRTTKYDGQSRPVFSKDTAGTVELSYTKQPDQSFIIPPGEAYTFVPSDVTKLYVRSRKGNAVVSLHVLPE
jgi:hypothetical protein